MKILYAIQATGNGHLARSLEIVPILQELGEVEVIVSGIQGNISLPFEIKKQFYGFSFIFGKKGGVDILGTVLRMKLFRLFRDILTFPVNDYDLIINDFEPVTAWACKFRKKECVGLSHQNAVLHPNASKPQKKDILGKLVLKNYAPSTFHYGFHFEAFDIKNFTPVIRSSIRKAIPKDDGFYTVYLPAFGDEEIREILGSFENVRWEVFSKHCKQAYKSGNIHFQPVSVEGFNNSFVNCTGILCTAGFETPAEAIFMGKKLCVIPMKNQYEQQCNAAQLASLGVKVVHEKSDLQEKVGEWLAEGKAISIPYPDDTRRIMKEVVTKHGNAV